MGVQGLWQLIQPVGRPVSLQSMEGKVLAVDVSLWLHQLAKGMRDKDGEPLPHAHLLGLFTRICKLLFYRIKPIFVFDGGVPPLKKQTLAHRKEKKHNAEKESDKASQKILSNFVKSQIIGQALGKSETEARPRPSNSKFDDMFILPPLPKDDNRKIGDNMVNTSWEDRLAQQQLIQEEFEDMENLDIESEDFRTMSSEVQYEILTELRLSRRESSWAKLDQFPNESNDFSSYQLKNLLKKGRLSNRLDEVQRDINMRTCGQLSMNIDEAYFNEIFESRRVISEDSAHSILIKGIKNKEQDVPASGAKIPENNMAAANSEADGQELNDDSTCGSEQVDLTSELVNLSEIYNLNRENNNGSSEIQCTQTSGDYNSQLLHKSGDLINDTVSDKITNKKEMSSKNSKQTSMVLLEDTDVEECDRNDMKRHHDSTKEDKVADRIQAKKSKVPDHTAKHKEVHEKIDVDKVPTCIDLSDNSDDDFIEVSNLPIAFPRRPNDSVESDNVIDISDDSIQKDSASKTDIDDLFPVSLFDKTNVIDIRTSDCENEADVVSIPPAKTESTVSEVVSDHSTEDIDKNSKPVNCNVIVVNEHGKADDVEVIGYSVNETKNVHETEDSEHVVLQTSSLIGQTAEERIHVSSNETSKDDSNFTNEFVGMSKNDLETLHTDLVKDTRRLQTERNKQDRHAVSITDQMYQEAQELLSLFGIPFVLSPMEAEAQCAHLDLTNQVHGTITDDSDVWLFGGKRVYKNFFNLNRHVEFYRNSDIMSQFGLDRDKLINIALLCGSDYTDGIQGVGGIKALEIMAEFPGEGMESLVAFKSWWDANVDVTHSTSTILSKLKNLAVHPGFPNHVVFNAYKTPMVDTSDEPFSWSLPDLGQLRDYASIRFGWTRKKIDDMLLPVLKNLSKAKLQSNITGYFQPEFHMAKDKIKSNRIKTVTDKLLRKSSESSSTMEAKASTSTGGITTCTAKSVTANNIKTKEDFNDAKVKNRKAKDSSKADDKLENENNTKIHATVSQEASNAKRRSSKAKDKELPPVKPLPIVDLNEVRKQNAIVIWKKVQKTNTVKSKGKKSTYFKRNVKGEGMVTVEAPSEVNLSESSDSD